MVTHLARTLIVMEHVTALAQAKALPAGFYEDRRSVYWENNIPRKDYTKTTKFVLNPRQEQLVYNKRLHPEYVLPCLSPIWLVSMAALKANATDRLTVLARPKTTHPDYSPCKPMATVIPRAAFSARASHRLQELATHKTYLTLKIKPESEWDWGEWKMDISRTALKADPSLRLVELSLAKKTHKLYLPNRAVRWPVKRSVLQHSASDRQTKLAQAKQLPRYQEDYNPHRWTVPRAALMALASPRLEELSKPLPRKCCTRK